MEWYYAEGENRVGPVSDTDMNALATSGKVRPETLVWHDGMAGWQPYSSVRPGGAPATAPGLRLKPYAAPEATLPGSQTPHACSVCGKPFPADEMIQYQNSWVCAACKPIFFQRVKEGASVPGVMDYAGFWIRVGARFVDGIILYVVNTLVGVVAGAGIAAGGSRSALHVGLQIILMFIGIGIGAAYTIWFTGKYGATPGKMACKIKVVRADGSPLTYGRACGRYFADMVNGLTLGIGYIMVAFDEEKRGLHDRICDTRVIRIP